MGVANIHIVGRHAHFHRNPAKEGPPESRPSLKLSASRPNAPVFHKRVNAVSSAAILAFPLLITQ
jgi:hypothetical protein